MNPFFVKILHNKYSSFFLFSLFTLFFYNFYSYLFIQPQGLHFIRQTDSLAFVDNYIQNGFNFFKTSNYNLTATDGNAVSEFPIFYYIYAIIIKTTSSGYYIIRFLNLSLIYFSLFYLYKTIFLLISRGLLSAFLTFLFYSSTVLIFYSFSFLPDINSIALCFIANYFVVDFLKNDNTLSIPKAGILLVLSTIIKPSFIIYLIAFYTCVLIVKKFNLKFVLQIIIALIIVFAWVLYIKYYNNKYNQTYYLSTFKPIWNCTKLEINETFDFIMNYWFSKYYYQSTFHLFLVTLLFSPYIFAQNIKNILTKFCIFIIVGLMMYFLLFFKQFKDHDYYFIVFIPGIAIVITFLLNHILKLFTNKAINTFIAIVVVSITLLSINYSNEKLKERFNKEIDNISLIGFKLRGADKFLDSVGIEKNKKFIVLGDESFSGGLFFIKRKGWCVPNLEGHNMSFFEDKLGKADYLIITCAQKNNFHKKEFFPYSNKVIYYYNNNSIIKLK